MSPPPKPLEIGKEEKKGPLPFPPPIRLKVAGL